LWITRPDLPVAAWPTADHSVVLLLVSGLMEGLEMAVGEVWDSIVIRKGG
jgi:hypothetical protein